MSLRTTKLWQNPEYRAKNRGAWKGDNAKIPAFHVWLRKKHLCPLYCENCGRNARLDLANVKNHEYTRNPDDYRWLCRSCHVRFDRGYLQLNHIELKTWN